MSEVGFIKLSRSKKCEWLFEKHPFAYLLLTQIAFRARRTPNGPDGCDVGECHIGDYENCGIPSRKIYRSALEKLIKEGAIKIVETCRNRKKGATGRATIGTKVKILGTEFYDINIIDDGQQKGHRGATDGPPKGHEQECKKEIKKTTTTNIDIVKPAESPKSEPVVVASSQTSDKETVESLIHSLSLFPEDKEWLRKQKPSLERLKLAIEYCKAVEIRTTLIQTLIWHIRCQIPPRSEDCNAKRLARHYNAQLDSLGFYKVNKKNQDLILKGALLIWDEERKGFVQISLKKPYKELFDEITNSYKHVKKFDQITIST